MLFKPLVKSKGSVKLELLRCPGEDFFELEFLPVYIGDLPNLDPKIFAPSSFSNSAWTLKSKSS